MDFYSFKKIDGTGLAKTLFTTNVYDGFGFNNPEHMDNYIKLGKSFGLTPSDMVRTNQTHTSIVRLITRANAGEGITCPGPESGSDGMVTNEPGLMLCTVEADCVPVYLLDPVNKAIGMVHSGWRGTAGHISANAISLMKKSFGTDPGSILAAIGPCICKDCYEVTKDLKESFLETFSPEEVSGFFTPKPNGRYWLDLKAAITATLTGAGVLPENIEDSGFCTFHDSQFHSWRRDGRKDGRMLTAICLV